MQEREAYIAFNMMEKVGPVLVRSLAQSLGSAAAGFTVDRDALLRVEGVGTSVAEAIIRQRDEVGWQAELAQAEAQGIQLITQMEPDYPEILRAIYDPPLVLYVQGKLLPRDRHALAIVGTRHPTPYGAAVAERMAYQLAQAGWTIVSGLAEGIDTAAHRGALKAGGRTLAVMGSALDQVYPASNQNLAREIVAAQGAVISEFPFGRAPDRTTFAIRNRIVSGLSQGVVVVEAGFKSGALITVDQALEQGRQVFAVPGRVDTAAAQGCLQLIRNGATLVRGFEDVLESFEQLPLGAVAASMAPPRPAVSPEEERILQALEAGEMDVDSLIRATELPPASIGSLLICLEMKRLIRMLPGRLVAKG
jgi:DNA processing protein